MSEIFQQIEQAKKEAKDGADNELPEGASPIEARAEVAEGEEVAEESAVEEATDADAEGGDGDVIRIGDREFKTQLEAIKYAEQLEREKAQAEAYNQGIRDTLQAKGEQEAAPVEQEDNFEERFYANPKETLKEVRAQARDEAVNIIRQEAAREKQWDAFLNKYPNVRRKDAERVLQENWETLGKMTDLDKAMGVLANTVLKEYDEIVERVKPRTELSNKKGQAVSPSGGTRSGVTPQKKDDKPLDFVSQMRKLRE